MEPLTFKKAVIQHFNLNEKNYSKFVLKKTLFGRVRVVFPIIQFFYPDYLFNEKRLVEKVGEAVRLREIQEEIDFYQHKYVVNSILKEALKYRLSGMKLIRMANTVFNKQAPDPGGKQVG